MEQSWILINPAVREGLPNSYLEAAAHRTALLSYVDPDGFASRFGYHAATDNFHEGLSILLQHQTWKDQALKGYQYVHDTFALPYAMDAHENMYASILSNT